MNPDKTLIAKQQKTIEDLNAELAYWKDTAEFYMNELNKTKQNKTLDN